MGPTLSVSTKLYFLERLPVAREMARLLYHFNIQILSGPIVMATCDTVMCTQGRSVTSMSFFRRQRRDNSGRGWEDERTVTAVVRYKGTHVGAVGMNNDWACDIRALGRKLKKMSR